MFKMEILALLAQVYMILHNQFKQVIQFYIHFVVNCTFTVSFFFMVISRNPSNGRRRNLENFCLFQEPLRDVPNTPEKFYKNYLTPKLSSQESFDS